MSNTSDSDHDSASDTEDRGIVEVDSQYVTVPGHTSNNVAGSDSESDNESENNDENDENDAKAKAKQNSKSKDSDDKIEEESQHSTADSDDEKVTTTKVNDGSQSAADDEDTGMDIIPTLRNPTKPQSRRKKMATKVNFVCAKHEMVFAMTWVVMLFVTACLITGALYSTNWHYLTTQITREVVFENTTTTTNEDATNSCGVAAFCRYYSGYGGFIHSECSTFGSEVSSIPFKEWRDAACFVGVSMVLAWLGVVGLVICFFCDRRLRKPVSILNIIIVGCMFIGMLLYGDGLKHSRPPVLGQTFTLKNDYCKFCPRAEAYNNGDCTLGSGAIAAIFAFVFAAASACIGVWVPSHLPLQDGATPRTVRQTSTFRAYRRSSVGPGAIEPDDLNLMSPMMSPTNDMRSPHAPTSSLNHQNTTTAV
eukprot:m.51522 g.51522  ORF g.51522 m.51522 type:complete len:422 (-) comp21459_c0_seq1:130-1395(-)